MIEKTESILRKMREVFKNYVVREMWCEMPQFFDDSGGHMAAKTGDLLKLTFFVGALKGTFPDAEMKLVTPSQWKGQRSKDSVIRKIRHINPKIEGKSHSWDAIGIGYYGAGVFKRK